MPHIWKNDACLAVFPTLSMSTVRTHFWTLVARGHGRGSVPRKYGLKGTIPALTSNNVGSVATRLALGTRVWPRATKCARKRRLISAESISGRTPIAPWHCSGPHAGYRPAAPRARHATRVPATAGYLRLLSAY